MSPIKEIREKLDTFEKEEFTDKDLESCRESIGRMRNQASWALRELRESTNLLESYEKVLKFYGDKNTHRTHHITGISKIVNDFGEKARQTMTPESRKQLLDNDL